MAQTTSTTQARTTNRGGSNTQQATRFEDVPSNLQQEQVNELLCQALETEIGGVKVYETAIRCAQNDDLREEWNKYLDETRNHERILTDVFEILGLDTDHETPGRGIVRANGEALVKAMEMALGAGDPKLAEIVAAECVVLAETKDHLNWELIGEVSKEFEGEGGTALREAYGEVEEQEDEHLYHTRGWARELWLDAFGLPAVLPPPEEQRKVHTEVDASRAKNARTRMIAGKRGGRATRSKKTTRSKGTKRSRTTKPRARGR